ncbi:MAG: GNAT family N-acetyltransferase [archaeon]
MNIREYKHEDLELVLHQMDGRYSKRREDKFQLVEKCPNAFYCLVAEENSKIRGFIIMEDLGDGISHYMLQVNVAEKRKGIGKSLVKRVFDKIGHGGHVSLCVNTDNEEAIKFYEALGFKRSGYNEGYRKNQNKYWYQIDI